jgi:hypothetical protein
MVVPTVNVSVGVEWVLVPSVPWMVKLNVPMVSLSRVTVNGDPPDVGMTAVGVNAHVPGALPEQLTATAVSYPFAAVSVPFQVTG